MIYLAGALFQLNLVWRIQSFRWAYTNLITENSVVFNFHSMIFFQQFNHIYFEVVVLLMVMFVGLSNLFLYCFLGKLATDSFEEMADCLYNSNWMVLPVQLQKYLIIMIENIQQPICYHGFKIINLDLITFITVREIRKPICKT